MKKKANISIFSLGGTILAKASSSTSSAYSSGELDISEHLEHLPLKHIANFKAYQLASIGSQEMDEATLLLLAQKVLHEVNKKNIDGVLVLHGSDTLEEVAYFLHLTIKTKKPIVFTAAMRSNSSLSKDGDLNIFNALSLAANKKARKKGVLVSLNEEIHCAREVSKTHTSSVQTFSSPNSGKLGSVYYAKPNFNLKSLKKHTYKSTFELPKHLPQVDIVYSHLHHNDKFVNLALNNGTKGIVIAGFGNGNIYPSTLKALQKASQNGVFVLRSSRVGSGIVNENGEINDKKTGFLSANDLNPQKARILLQLALTKTNDINKIRKILAKY